MVSAVFQARLTRTQFVWASEQKFPVRSVLAAGSSDEPVDPPLDTPMITATTATSAAAPPISSQRVDALGPDLVIGAGSVPVRPAVPTWSVHRPSNQRTSNRPVGSGYQPVGCSCSTTVHSLSPVRSVTDTAQSQAYHPDGLNGSNQTVTGSSSEGQVSTGGPTHGAGRGRATLRPTPRARWRRQQWCPRLDPVARRRLPQGTNEPRVCPAPVQGSRHGRRVDRPRRAGRVRRRRWRSWRRPSNRRARGSPTTQGIDERRPPRPADPRPLGARDPRPANRLPTNHDGRYAERPRPTPPPQFRPRRYVRARPGPRPCATARTQRPPGVPTAGRRPVPWSRPRVP